MISKILKLKNVGLLKDATPNGAVALERVTALYADNGRGKSTLATILRACQLGDAGRLLARRTIDATNAPEVEFLLHTGGHVEFDKNEWTAKLQNIIVFDSEFVEQNVYSGFEVRPDQRQSLLEFALGDQTVPLQKQILQLTKDITLQTQKRTLAETMLTGYAKPYTTTDFIALQSEPNAQQKIDALKQKIEAAKNAQNLSMRKDPVDIVPIQFDTTALFIVLKTKLQDLEKVAEAVVKSHFAKHNSEDFEDWVSRGQQYSDSTDCPFCGQDISSLELVNAYRSYFNKAYIDLKQQVSGLVSIITNGLADSKVEAALSTAETNGARIEAWKDLLDVTVPEIDGSPLVDALRQLREDLLALVAIKQRSPLDATGSDADADKALATLERINQAIASYNSSLKSVIFQITDFKKNLATEDTITLSTEIRKLEAAQRRLQPDIADIVKDHQAAEAERKRLDSEKVKARKQLDGLMQATLEQYQSRINDLLDAFGAEFKIEQFKPTYLGGGEPRGEYGLRVRNKSVKLGSRADITTTQSFANTLSEADKRTLAFAFFIARLKADPNLANKIVILDDPVSSLDRNRRYQSIRHIADLASDCEQLLVLSHDGFFIREFKERLADRVPTPITPLILTIKRVGQGYSAFAGCDIEDVCSSDYYRHHRLVADYVDGKSTTNTRDVAKAIRPLLEGYYHRRFPGRIPRKLMFGRIIALAAQAQPPNPLRYLHSTLEEMKEINDFASQFHHDTNPDYETVPVVDGELLPCAKKALKLIYENG